MEFKKFLNQINQTVPVDFDVHLICDNLVHPQDPGDRRLAGRPPPVPSALHPDQLIVAEPGRTPFGLLTDRQLRRRMHDNGSRAGVLIRRPLRLGKLRGYSDDHSVGDEAVIAARYACSVAAAVLSQLNVAACAAALMPILSISS